MIRRLFWYGVGGGLAYAVNLGAFLLLRDPLGLDRRIAYALSLALVTGVNFAWSYLVNFRTDARVGRCLPRYCATLGSSYPVNYAITQTGFVLWPGREKVVILAAMVFVAGLKFLIYDSWVFPRRLAARQPSIPGAAGPRAAHPRGVALQAVRRRWR